MLRDTTRFLKAAHRRDLVDPVAYYGSRMTGNEQNSLKGLWVAQDMNSGEVVGCVAMEQAEVRQAEVRRLAVADSHRRRGLGTELIREVEAFCSAHGIQHLFATSVTLGTDKSQLANIAATARQRSIVQAFYLYAGYQELASSWAGELQILRFERSLSGTALTAATVTATIPTRETNEATNEATTEATTEATNEATNEAPTESGLVGQIARLQEENESLSRRLQALEQRLALLHILSTPWCPFALALSLSKIFSDSLPDPATACVCVWCVRTEQPRQQSPGLCGAGGSPGGVYGHCCVVGRLSRGEACSPVIACEQLIRHDFATTCQSS